MTDGTERDWRQALRDHPATADLAPVELDDAPADAAGLPVLVAAFRLQGEADPRGAIQAWFARVAEGGRLVLLVPHAFLHERQLALPAPWDARQRRLYSPRALLDEVEEALAPNSYRVRHLADLDAGYDYAAPGDMAPPLAASAILLVVERIAPPAWAPLPVARAFLAPPEPAAPDYAFEPPRTRIEVARTGLDAVRRLFVIKPDHLGDLVMALPALERLRGLFPHAHLTLLVGTWNADMARGLGLADEVIGFDLFPRNSTEERVDVAGRAALFREAVRGRWDLAVDLRADGDTRFLLAEVDATVRAGLGTRAQFPFLDIFLPLDFNRNWVEAAEELLFDHHAFATQGPVRRHRHRAEFRAADVERQHAIIWGPYRPLRPGRYLFDPYLEVAPGQDGLLMLDIGLDAARVAELYVDGRSGEGGGQQRLAFAVERAGAEFEFRAWAVDQGPPLDFSFYGGRLIREGGRSVLHQSEYQRLLVELVAMRLGRTGQLAELAA